MLPPPGALAAASRALLVTSRTRASRSPHATRHLQVSQQRWLTVGALLFLGGAGLLAADSVRAQSASPRLGWTAPWPLPACRALLLLGHSGEALPSHASKHRPQQLST